ncbi:MAG: D-glycero-beta-D-manno-heptose 1,7-bisphosphate 7-phosphatase [Alphaproteobacteria bacterium]|nr:MAG: D-glycero-beta-D-manno-heptose 1,7-bisphosphate 7-phosphatase [Alphaproteobacteria bacterium]
MTWLVVLDRDGVINEDRVDYVKSVDEFVMIDGAAGAIARMNRMGWRVAVATNQSCIGKGIITESRLYEIHDHMNGLLKKSGAQIDKIYFAPDHPDRPTNRRKPGPGMLIEAMMDFGISSTRTIMIGDALRDLQAAKDAGCRRCLIKTGKGEETLASGLPSDIKPLLLADNLNHAVDLVMQLETEKKTLSS